MKLLKAAHARRKEATAAAADKATATSGAAAAAKAPPFGAKDAALSYPGTGGGGGGQGNLFRPGQRTGTGGFTAGAAAQQPLAPAVTGGGVGPFGGVAVPGRFGGGGGISGHGTGAVPAAGSAATMAGPGLGEGGRAGEGQGDAPAGSREEVEALLVDGKKEEVCVFVCLCVRCACVRVCVCACVSFLGLGELSRTEAIHCSAAELPRCTCGQSLFRTGGVHPVPSKRKNLSSCETDTQSAHTFV